MTGAVTEIRVFTGIIEGQGRITDVVVRDDGAGLTIDLAAVAEGVRIGDSISVDGCCLTVVTLEKTTARFDAVPETTSRTTLGGFIAGRRVNLERALRLGDRLGGHLVSGHVDAVGHVRGRASRGSEERFEIEAPSRFHPFLVEKGSIAVDGISLTVAAVNESGFAAAIVPHTLAVTTLGERDVGAPVNLEFDVLAKWVDRLVRHGRIETGTPLANLLRPAPR